MAATGLHFGVSINPSAYYPSQAHEHVLGLLKAGLEDLEPCQLVIGDNGAGKSFLATKLLELVGEQFDAVFMPQTRYEDANTFLRDLAVELDIEISPSTLNVRACLEQHVLMGYDKGRHCLIIVDGGQTLIDKSLADLEGLCSLIGARGPAVCLVLLGTQALTKHLMDQNPAWFKHRIGGIYTLASMDPTESADFIRHQIRRAGGNPDRLVDIETLEALIEWGEGNPGRLMQGLRASWRMARSSGMDSLDLETFLSAREMLTLNTNNAENLSTETQETVPMAHSRSA